MSFEFVINIYFVSGLGN